jgi:hypothetical protein
MASSKTTQALPAALLTALLLIACSPGTADHVAPEPRAEGLGTEMETEMKPTDSSAPSAAPTAEDKFETLSTEDVAASLQGERATLTIEVPEDIPETASGKGERLGLYLEGLELNSPGVYYEVYAEIPEGAEPQAAGPNYLGTLSLFGPKGNTDAKAAFDITGLVRDLKAKGRWDGDLQLTFVRRGLEPPKDQPGMETVPENVPPVRFKRVRIVREVVP